MRRLISLATLVVLLSVPVLAGDTNSPGKTDPPPCTSSCTTGTTATTDPATTLSEELLLLIVSTIKL